MGEGGELKLNLAAVAGSAVATGCSELLLLETNTKMGLLYRHRGLNCPELPQEAVPIHSPAESHTSSSAGPVVV